MIRVHRVTQAEGVGQERRGEQDRVLDGRHEGQHPGRDVEGEQEPVQPEDAAAKRAGRRQKAGEAGDHGFLVLDSGMLGGMRR